MSMTLLIPFLGIYTGLSVFGLYFIKNSSSVFSAQFISGFALYASGFLLWLFLLKKMPLSLIFPLCSSCILIGTQLAGWFLLGEAISYKAITAVTLSVIACILIATEM